MGFTAIQPTKHKFYGYTSKWVMVMNGISPDRCLNCNEELLNKPYCSSCGQRAAHKRLNLTALLDDLFSQILDVKLPWLYTIRELTSNPSKVCHEYVEGKRIRYVNPLKYALYITAIVAFIIHLLPHGENLLPMSNLYDWKIARLSPIALFFARNSIILVLLLSPVIVLFLRMAYRKTKYNRTEINCFVFYLVGHNALIYLVTLAFFILLNELYRGFELNPSSIIIVGVTYMILAVSYVFVASLKFFASNKIYTLIVSGLIYIFYFFIFAMTQDVMGI